MQHAYEFGNNCHDQGRSPLHGDRARRNLKNPRVSVVIPTLNEAKNLSVVLPRLPEGLFEVLLVDGGSTDGTVETARELRPDVRVVEQTGRGKGNALYTGLAAARGDILVTLDADGSADPAEIPRFVAALVAGADVAKGSRFAQGGGSADITRARRLGNRALCILVNRIYGTYYTDLCYGYNAFWADCLPALCTPRPLYAADPALESPLGEGFEVETVLNVRAAKGALRVWEVPSYELRRIHGQSNLNALRDGMRVVRTIWGECPAISARYSPTAAAPADAVAGTLPESVTITAAEAAIPLRERMPQLSASGDGVTELGRRPLEAGTADVRPVAGRSTPNGHGSTDR
ncbi:glycosyltransferase family 2 protein [Nocardioides xinjiangensis]|uniref:glycosyltransferase family 2 protein n=1 Tax=Nocardioides xinjiangensis TaxID=2817376 RepID=UPI001B30A20E|nr:MULTISPECIES: glycosyltransferase family 2 protein [unclassified Nocardioides]